MISCLALDLGTKTGYAFNKGEDFHAGTWTLASATEVANWNKVRLCRRKDPRVGRLCEKIASLGYFNVLVFEDVQFHSSTYQTQLWSALRAAAWLCGEAQVFEAVPVKTLKAFAGHGNADKKFMNRALKARHPTLWKPEYNDDAIDAIWLWIWAQKNLGRLAFIPTPVSHHD